MKKHLHTPIKVGITGGIGAGKSTVCNIFNNLGIPIFNADDHSKMLLTQDSYVIDEVIKVFGQNILTQEKIDTTKLGHIVFSNKEKLKILTNILHPRVLEKFNRWSLNQQSKYIIKESALIFESRTNNNLDKIILIQAPLDLRIKRVCIRDKRHKNEVSKIIKNQTKDSKVVNLVDYIIVNDEQTLITSQVIEIHKKLSRL